MKRWARRWRSTCTRTACRRVAIVTADDPRAGVRREGFVQASARLGSPDVPVCVVPAPSALGHGRSGLAELLAPPARDRRGVLQLRHACARRDHRSARAGHPDTGRLAVFGFGDFAFAADTHPALTTVRIDGTGIGRQAARFIIDRAEGRPVAERVVDIGFSIVERASA